MNPPTHNWNDMYVDDGVFLALDVRDALDYMYDLDMNEEDIVVLKVPLSKLNSKYINYDWNNKCEYSTDINSIKYEHNIPSNCLTICNPKTEPSQCFADFEGTDLYDIIFDTFWEEVESNHEREDNYVDDNYFDIGDEYIGY